MKNEEFNYTLLKERVVALRSLKEFSDKKEFARVDGEIKYIEGILQANEFSGDNDASVL